MKNLIVTLIISMTGWMELSAQDDLFVEDFEDAAGFENWTGSDGISGQGGSQAWALESEYTAASGQSYAAIHQSETYYGPCRERDQALVSPRVQAGEEMDVVISFWQRFMYADSFQNHFLYFITSDGEWILVKHLDSDATSDTDSQGWQRFQATLRPWIEAYGSEFRVAFRYRTQEQSTAYVQCPGAWHLDLVAIQVNQSPETVISLPSEDRILVKRGDTVRFVGGSYDPEGDATAYWWEFCPREACRFSGREQQFTFEDTGQFEAICWARDAFGNEDPSPDRVEVIVVEDLPPSAEIVVADAHSSKAMAPRSADRRLVIGVGDAIDFEGSARDADSATLDQGWYLPPSPEVVSREEHMTNQFDEPGRFVVLWRAEDEAGNQAYDYRVVDVVAPGSPVPPLATILSPEEGQRVELGEAITLCAAVSDPDTEFDDCQNPSPAAPQTERGRMIWAISDGSRHEGGRVENVTFSVPGRYKIRLTAWDGTYRDVRETWIVVTSRSYMPKPDIIHPCTDLYVSPGTPIYLEAAIRGGNFTRKYFRWEIRKRGTDVVREIRQSTPGAISIDQEGTYDVRVVAVHPDTDRQSRESDARVITIGPGQAFGDHSDPEQAAALTPGFHEEKGVEGARYFRVQVPVDQQRLCVELQANGPTIVTLMNEQLEPLVTRQINGVGSLQALELTRGSYLVEVMPNGSNKQGLDFGLNVAVLNPSLYLPSVSTDSWQDTVVGLVNPGDETVEAEVIGYTAQGVIAAKVPVQIPPYGRYADTSSSLFGVDASRVAWVRVDATHRLQGYSRTKTRDETESFAVSGTDRLTADLFVPHIAQQTQQWTTRAVVVNGSANVSSSRIVAGNDTQDLLNEGRYTSDAFDFATKFQGTVPPTGWGVCTESNAGLMLAGVEVFSRVDGVQQTAGLQLSDLAADNPNFTFVRNNIYFAHIARETQQFWTGLALVNSGNASAGMTMIAYGDGGAEVGRKSMTLEAGEKIVGVETSVLDFVAPEAVSWVKVEADAPIVGYELFGTHDNRRLAGLEGIRALANSLCFPHIDRSQDDWFGIALVNVSDAVADIKITLRDNAGQALAQSSLTLQPHEKVVSLAQDLFDVEEDQLNGWIQVNSNQLLAGFQLFGDHGGRTMAATLGQ